MMLAHFTCSLLNNNHIKFSGIIDLNCSRGSHVGTALVDKEYKFGGATAVKTNQHHSDGQLPEETVLPNNEQNPAETFLAFNTR